MRRNNGIRSIIFVCCIMLIMLIGCGSTKNTVENTAAHTPESEPDAQAANMPIEETDTNASEEPEQTEPGKSSEITESTESKVENPQTSIQSPSTCGQLQVSGTKLVDSNGNPVQLKGISTHGIAWFPQYINAECFKQLRDEWNVNVIRLAMYTEESKGYCSDGDRQQLKQLLRDGVQYATEADMYVIIDWHILSDGNPQTHKTEAIEFFSEMTKEFANQNNVIYEICNEPNGAVTWAEIKDYAEDVIPVIRENAPDAVILVGTPNWSQYVDQAVVDPITNYQNLMYTLHFYAATHTDSLRNTMTAAIDAGLPIFVSEYGICDASGNGAIDQAQADAWVKLMNQQQISYVMWNLSNKDESSAILLNSCPKTSGFLPDDLSPSGQWLVDMLARGKISETSEDA